MTLPVWLQGAAPDRAALLNEAAANLTADGWEIVNRSEGGLQICKRRQWSRAGLLVFVLLPLLGGCLFSWLWVAALLGFAFVALDYLLKRDELDFVSIEQLEQEYWQAQSRPKKN